MLWQFLLALCVESKRSKTDKSSHFCCTLAKVQDMRSNMSWHQFNWRDSSLLAELPLSALLALVGRLMNLAGSRRRRSIEEIYVVKRERNNWPLINHNRNITAQNIAQCRSQTTTGAAWPSVQARSQRGMAC